MSRAGGAGRAWPFIAGTFAGVVAGAVGGWLLTGRRRTLDSRLVRALSHGRVAPPLVVVPGLLGSQLLRPDGTVAWLNLGNALGHHDLGLPRKVPFTESRDDLQPGPLLGTDAVLPRAFGFTEYADLVELLDEAGFEPGAGSGGLRYAIFSYDWRRDLVESARELGRRLDAIAASRGQTRYARSTFWVTAWVASSSATTCATEGRSRMRAPPSPGPGHAAWRARCSWPRPTEVRFPLSGPS